jgi:hypothetical protein
VPATEEGDDTNDRVVALDAPVLEPVAAAAVDATVPLLVESYWARKHAAVDSPASSGMSIPACREMVVIAEPP